MVVLPNLLENNDHADVLPSLSIPNLGLLGIQVTPPPLLENEEKKTKLPRLHVGRLDSFNPNSSIDTRLNEVEINVDRSKESDGELDLDALCDEFESGAVNIADHSSIKATKSNKPIKERNEDHHPRSSNESQEVIRL